MTRVMRRDGWPALCGIHGDKQQKERDWILGEFQVWINDDFVATDVAARGLDVDDVKFVINYDSQITVKTIFLQKIGRTDVRKLWNLLPYLPPATRPKPATWSPYFRSQTGGQPSKLTRTYQPRRLWRRSRYGGGGGGYMVVWTWWRRR